MPNYACNLLLNFSKTISYIVILNISYANTAACNMRYVQVIVSLIVLAGLIECKVRMSTLFLNEYENK